MSPLEITVPVMEWMLEAPLIVLLVGVPLAYGLWQTLVKGALTGWLLGAALAVLTAIAMPFTYSIANGLAFGFVSYAVLKLLTGRAREVHPATWLVAALFVVRFVFFPQG